MCDKEYNGYANFNSWLLALNLDNDQYLNEELHRIANCHGSIYDKAQQLKEFVEELFYVEEYGIYKIWDVWSQREFDQIDWYDIVESHVEEE